MTCEICKKEIIKGEGEIVYYADLEIHIHSKCKYKFKALKGLAVIGREMKTKGILSGSTQKTSEEKHGE